MYKRYYRRYNNEEKSKPEQENIELEQPRHVDEADEPAELSGHRKKHKEEERRNFFDIFKNPKMDDLVLLALIFIFMQESNEDDNLMLILLAFLFISGI